MGAVKHDLKKNLRWCVFTFEWTLLFSPRTQSSGCGEEDGAPDLLRAHVLALTLPLRSLGALGK